MKIVVNHLTRMQQGYFCVARIDLDSLRHVRPVIARQQMSVGLLARYDGPFDMARIIELGPVRHVPDGPHVEDHQFDPTAARAGETYDGAEFWQLLRTVARPQLGDLFGRHLKRVGAHSCAVSLGQGETSLGCLLTRSCPRLYVQPRTGKSDQIRMRLCDSALDVDLPVTDIRLYGDDHVTPNLPLVERCARRLREARPLVVSMGLTRPSQSSRGCEPLHCLQVNNLHFADAPTWQLG